MAGAGTNSGGTVTFSGHHVTCKLSFPADKLAGAKTLTLIIKDVAGVAERTFTWNLQ